MKLELHKLKKYPVFKSLRCKALFAIEHIVAQWNDWADQDEMATVIYRFSHVAMGHCEAKHDDWAQELEEFYDKIKPDREG